MGDSTTNTWVILQLLHFIFEYYSSSVLVLLDPLEFFSVTPICVRMRTVGASSWRVELLVFNAVQAFWACISCEF